MCIRVHWLTVLVLFCNSQRSRLCRRRCSRCVGVVLCWCCVSDAVLCCYSVLVSGGAAAAAVLVFCCVVCLTPCCNFAAFSSLDAPPQPMCTVWVFTNWRYMMFSQRSRLWRRRRSRWWRSSRSSSRLRSRRCARPQLRRASPPSSSCVS